MKIKNLISEINNALKRYFLKTYLIDSLARASFEELKILKRLKNPYLVNLVDTFYDEIMFCVLIEHYEVGIFDKLLCFL